MSNEADNLPTLQTILERINYVATTLHEFQVSVDGRLGVIEHQLEQMDIRLDRIESFSHQTRSEVLALRADIKEFKSALSTE